MHKIAEVESLRAYSVFGVVLFHYNHTQIGWMGVWVFFVISGFVITLSLMREPKINTVGQKIKNFYRRRVLRIGPLYLFLIIFALSFFVLFGPQPAGLPVFEHVLYLVTATYNFYRLSPDYLHTEFFGHYWSLCTEEQFYLIYPLMFCLLNTRKLSIILTAFIFLCPLLRVVVGSTVNVTSGSANVAASAVYFVSFLHFDAFSLGCLAALNKSKIESMPGIKVVFRNFALATLAAGMIYLLISVLLGEGRLTVRLAEAVAVAPRSLLGQAFLYSLISFVAVALIVGTLIRNRVVLMLTAWRPLQWIGEISFGIYMFHFPVLFLYKGTLSWLKISQEGPVAGLGLFGLYLAIVLGVSSLSFYHFEKPIARHFAARRRMSPSPTSA